jgi:hypothetical protein
MENTSLSSVIFVSLADWADHGWLRPHNTSDQEIANLLAIVERELHDSAVTQISQDARLGMLYNAALKLGDVALRGSGYRVAGGTSQHHHILMSLSLTLGSEWGDTADTLDAMRVLRNRADYECVGFATEQELSELRAIVLRMREAVTTRFKHA